MRSPTDRFSDRVDAYIRSRPGYPSRTIDLLGAECGLGPGSVVADVGAGTGIFSALLLRMGCTVFAVEPNAPMREAAERRLVGTPRFHSVAGTAERTTLPSKSVDLVTAAQAFHWFDSKQVRREFRRILKPGGSVVIVWNERLKDVDPFHADYERLLEKWGTDYRSVDRRAMDRSITRDFFAPHPFRTESFSNAQTLDMEGLKTRLLSSSYAPNMDSPNCAPMLEELEAIFARHVRDGGVIMRYRTVVHFGVLGGRDRFAT
jgi:SAM-dependent methyltransferase